jgi:hypothetical protein
MSTARMCVETGCLAMLFEMWRRYSTGDRSTFEKLYPDNHSLVSTMRIVTAMSRMTVMGRLIVIVVCMNEWISD